MIRSAQVPSELARAASRPRSLCGRNGGAVRTVAGDKIGLPPFDTSTETDAVADGVEEILVDTDIVLANFIHANHVTLHDPVELVGDVHVQHDAVRVGVFATCTEVAGRRDVGDRRVVSDRVAETTQPGIAAVKLVEAGVPTERPASVDFQIVAHRTRRDHAGVRERLAVVHRHGVAEEEVVRGGHDFVAHERIKVTDLDTPLTHEGFQI